MAGTPTGGGHAKGEGLCGPLIGHLDGEIFYSQQEFFGPISQGPAGKRPFGKHVTETFPVGDLPDKLYRPAGCFCL
jgi:hypothetical protein